MAYPKTIIFGPTGGVGSAAAQGAHQLGASVVLAMRDTSKPIPGLSSKEEASGTYNRVYANLSKPETVETAVRETGSKHAFIYFVSSQDHMRSTIEALKAGGVTFVVFLSSCNVQGDVRSFPPSNVAYWHAQVEVGLIETLGNEGYVALRPAYFTSNLLWWADDIRAGNVKVAYPQLLLDYIAPRDIGKVGGTLLVEGYKATEGAEDRNAVFLAGPTLRPLEGGFVVLGRSIGKDVHVTEVDEQEAVENLTKKGFEEYRARNIFDQFGKRVRHEPDTSFVRKR